MTKTKNQMRAPSRISQHAIDRYITRAEPSASRFHARRRIEAILTKGRRRPNPRHWMRGRVHQRPGLHFVYWAEVPHVCLLVTDGVVVTVVTRSLCRGPRWGEAKEDATSGGRPAADAQAGVEAV